MTIKKVRKYLVYVLLGLYNYLQSEGRKRGEEIMRQKLMEKERKRGGVRTPCSDTGGKLPDHIPSHILTKRQPPI
jgi:hypothetical protein